MGRGERGYKPGRCVVGDEGEEGGLNIVVLIRFCLALHWIVFAEIKHR